MTNITMKYAERMANNPDDLAEIVADMLQEMEGLHIELKAIHDVIMCIAEAKPTEEDTYTVKEVKRLADRVVELQQYKEMLDYIIKYKIIVKKYCVDGGPFFGINGVSNVFYTAYDAIREAMKMGKKRK